MPRAHAHPRRTTAVLAAIAVLAGLLVSLVPAASAQAAGALPGKVPSFGKAIESYERYVGQTVCSPSAKPGTVKLQKWLMTRYRGTGSLGIARSCSVGGRSEHKEGRALDWRVSVSSATQRAQVAAFLKLVVASDRYGNRDAVARRMGIMYLIWNDRIYSASDGFAGRAYRNASCKSISLARCGTTLRHRDHVHISLGWAGANARSSFWDGTVSSPSAPPVVTKPVVTKPVVTKPVVLRPVLPAVLDQRARPVVTMTVPTNGPGPRTPFSLKAGTTYRLVVTGYYAFGPGKRLADAACSWHRNDDLRWSRGVEGSTSTTRLKLAVGGRTTGWWSTDGGGCNSSDHTYVWDYTPTTTGPVTVTVPDTTAARVDNVGSLTLRVLRAGADPRPYRSSVRAAVPAPQQPVQVSTEGSSLRRTETVAVPPSGAVLTDGVLRAGRTYRVRVEGTWSAGEGITADAECSRVASSSTWLPQRSFDPLHPDQDGFDLYLDGEDLKSPGCSEDHVYEYDYTPQRDGRAQLVLWDDVTADDTGSVQVSIKRRW